MKHIAAYLLLSVGGNSSPTADEVKGILSSVGIEADNERLESLLKELHGKDIQEVSCFLINEEARSNISWFS